MMATETSIKFTQLSEGWLIEDWLVAQLRIPVKDIADRNGLTVQSWVEDGLGQLSGFGGHLPSGAMISLVESQHLVSSGRTRGPALYAIMADVDCRGTENLLAESLAALGLMDADVEGRARAPTADEVERHKRVLEEALLRAAHTGP